MVDKFITQEFVSVFLLTKLINNASPAFSHRLLFHKILKEYL
ncbi:MAG: hypothetical protein JWP12_3229 [Bacteroidetes bacterium]|nr:hypothetical protein [Bacteroidota bacterium]